MGQTLQRHLGPVQSMQGGMWTEETVSGRPALSCPACGQASDLPIESRVLKGGLVSPIWKCPSCAYQEFATLEAWEFEVLR